MKLHPEDPRLTAYVLGELNEEEAAAIQGAVEVDAALEAEVRDIRELQGILTEGLALPAAKLLPVQRDNIRRRARQAERAGKISRFDGVQRMLIPAAIAAVLAISTFILFRMSDEPAKPVASVETPVEKAAAPVDPRLPVPGPAQPSPAPVESGIVAAADVLPPLVPRDALKAAEFPSLDLPVQTGKSSLGWISDSIRKDGKLPPPDAVRLEEVLNAFPIRLNGITAIARETPENWHPDNRPDGVPGHLATVTVETVSCPWKPSAVLLLVSIRGNARADAEVKLSYQSNPTNVFRYRLLGFSPLKGVSSAAMPTTLRANTTTTLAIEIEPSIPGGDLGNLVWTAGGKPAPSVSIVHKADAEPSDDARFSALVCTFTQWLSGQQAGSVDSEVVSALARENASSDLTPEREAFLDLIDRSLHL